MAFVEDRTPFFADFGIDATVGAGTVRGIFDNAFLAQMGVLGSDPQFLCETADVTSLARGSPLTISGTGYKVVRKEADGTGMSVLTLELAA